MASLKVSSLLVLCSIVAVPSFANAATEVGSKATYRFLSAGSAVEVVDTVTDVHLDPANNYEALRMTSQFSNSSPNEGSMAIEHIHNALQRNEILNYCSFFNGTLEKVTVPAGTFSTCRYVEKDDSGSKTEYWRTNTDLVPMGLVKSSVGKLGESDYSETQLIHFEK